MATEARIPAARIRMGLESTPVRRRVKQRARSRRMD
jgi:hypothetical protein